MEKETIDRYASNLSSLDSAYASKLEQHKDKYFENYLPTILKEKICSLTFLIEETTNIKTIFFNNVCYLLIQGLRILSRIEVKVDIHFKKVFRNVSI